MFPTTWRNTKTVVQYTQMNLRQKEESMICRRFLNSSKREVLPEETSIQTVEMSTIKTALREFYNRENR